MAMGKTMQLRDPVAALSRAPQLQPSRGVAAPRSMVRLPPLCLHSLRSTTVSHPQRRRAGAVRCEAQESTATGVPGVVNESTWTSLVSESSVPVLVDFWAPWCGPCRMIAPIIDDIAKKYGGKVRCLKLNTDESPNVATEYGIRSIPTVMVFVKGVKRDTVIGAVPMQTLTSTLDKFIA